MRARRSVFLSRPRAREAAKHCGSLAAIVSAYARMMKPVYFGATIPRTLTDHSHGAPRNAKERSDMENRPHA